MATDTQTPVIAAIGGSFLIETRTPDEIFTYEDLSEEQRMIADTARDFMENEVVPRLDEILAHKFEVSHELMEKAGELGLLGVEIPEEYGGLGLDKVSGSLVSEASAREGSFAVTFMGHTGIGTLPVTYFGTEEQRKEVPAQVRHRRVGQLLLAVGSVFRIGRDEREGQGRPRRRREGVDPQRREDVAD